MSSPFESIIRLECPNDITLVAQDGFLLIQTKKTEEKIPVTSISSISVKKGGFLYGSITFNVMQGPSGSIHWGFGVSTTVGPERTFSFWSQDEKKAFAIRDYVLGWAEYKRTQDQAATAPSDPQKPQDTSMDMITLLRQLKALVDEGVITQEDFEAKKRQVLGI